jgi:hypothetical protein
VSFLTPEWVLIGCPVQSSEVTRKTWMFMTWWLPTARSNSSYIWPQVPMRQQLMSKLGRKSVPNGPRSLTRSKDSTKAKVRHSRSLTTSS